MQNGTQVQAVPDDYTLRIRQAAEIIGKSIKTLIVWRRKDVGPACVVREAASTTPAPLASVWPNDCGSHRTCRAIDILKEN